MSGAPLIVDWEPTSPGDFYGVFQKGEHDQVDFKVYEVAGRYADGRPSFFRRNYTRSEDHVDDVNEAQVFVSGTVSANNCANVHFDEQDRCMLHFCDKGQAQEIGDLLGRIYDQAYEMRGYGEDEDENGGAS